MQMMSMGVPANSGRADVYTPVRSKSDGMCYYLDMFLFPDWNW